MNQYGDIKIPFWFGMNEERMQWAYYKVRYNANIVIDFMLEYV